MHRAIRRLNVTCVFVSATALLQFAKAQTPLAQAEAGQQFRNIQVLKETPANQLVLSMHLIAGALGVGCSFCHVEVNGSIEGQFDKDDKETKKTARKMIAMVMDINKNSFGGRQVVTCYTCHRGSPKPLSVPILPVTLVAEHQSRSTALPTADEILTKYVEALGGEPLIRKVTSRVIMATRDIPIGPGGVVPIEAQVEIYQKAPNLVVNISRNDRFTTSDGFDGATAWSKNMAGIVADIPNSDQARTKRSADFYECLNLMREHTRLDVRGIEKVNGRDAYLIVAFPQSDSQERLYFDTKTGLLLRKWSVLQTPSGNTPFQMDYENYQDTGSGVKIPFVIRMLPASPRSELQTRSILQIEKVQDNVPIDNGKFAKPQSNLYISR